MKALGTDHRKEAEVGGVPGHIEGRHGPSWVRYADLLAKFCCRRRLRQMRNDYVGWVYILYAGVVYKMFSRGSDLDTTSFFIPPVRPALRGHPFKVLQVPCRQLRRKSSFSTRVVKYWNRLPTPIVTAPSVNSFKRQFDSAWEEVFAEVPLIPLRLNLPSPPPI